MSIEIAAKREHLGKNNTLKEDKKMALCKA